MNILQALKELTPSPLDQKLNKTKQAEVYSKG
jgi:hypothetical protein